MYDNAQTHHSRLGSLRWLPQRTSRGSREQSSGALSLGFRGALSPTNSRPELFSPEQLLCSKQDEWRRIALSSQLSMPKRPPVNLAFLMSAAFICRGTP